jgi:hypothetical protein
VSFIRGLAHASNWAARKSALIGIGGKTLEIMVPSKFMMKTGSLFRESQ